MTIHAPFKLDVKFGGCLFNRDLVSKVPFWFFFGFSESSCWSKAGSYAIPGFLIWLFSGSRWYRLYSRPVLCRNTWLGSLSAFPHTGWVLFLYPFGSWTGKCPPWSYARSKIAYRLAIQMQPVPANWNFDLNMFQFKASINYVNKSSINTSACITTEIVFIFPGTIRSYQRRE